MCDRMKRGVTVSEAVKICEEGTGRIYFIEKDDPEAYEWGTAKPLKFLEEAEEMFAVMRRTG